MINKMQNVVNRWQCLYGKINSLISINYSSQLNIYYIISRISDIAVQYLNSTILLNHYDKIILSLVILSSCYK